MNSVANLSLGQILITPGAKEAVPTYDVIQALIRHQKGDWGIVSDEDKNDNDMAVENGYRIISAYMSGDTKFWIITEWDRSATTIMLPEDY